MLVPDVVSREQFESELSNLFRIRAGKNLDDMIESNSEPALLANSIDARKKFLGGDRAIPHRARGKAVVAAATILFRALFAEVIQQEFPPALGNLGVMNHLL